LVASTHIGLQHGLTVNERVFKRFPSSNFPINGNETVDSESHGRELATKCWNEDTNFLAREKIAEYLGGP
jgi:PH/SEC7 domain-containing protein